MINLTGNPFLIKKLKIGLSHIYKKKEMPVIKNYLSLIKFSHTIFAMPFAMIGFFLGIKVFNFPRPDDPVGWEFSFFIFLLVVLCMVFARSAAMAFNRYLDRSFDAKNPRTVIREIPAGIIKANSVLLFTIANCLLFIACTFFINKICFFLSPVALLVVLGYSFTKRFTPLCHLILGLGLSLAPIGAYLAVTGHFSILPVIFSLCVLFWVSGFDIIYALQDEEFDKKHKLFSIPAWLGKNRGLRISEALHVLSAACVVVAGWLGGFGWLYWVGSGIFIGMLIYQHSIVKPSDLKRVNIAFMTANGIASVVFAIFVIADLFLNY
jgi:4-hydroxybenzoate polyprenyltransferase